MAKKLYVGNLSYNTDEHSIREVFSQYGEVVSVNVVTDRMTGRPRGFGFVEFDSEEAAQAAASALNGYDLDGRQLRVDEAKERSNDRNRY
ncbi:MAG: RNA-binding protein [Spirochaetales bacterium]|jgi:RNA recognition motif-containing protein|nr:RNA-binding protein [Spirochaetales bacterium]